MHTITNALARLLEVHIIQAPAHKFPNQGCMALTRLGVPKGMRPAAAAGCTGEGGTCCAGSAACCTVPGASVTWGSDLGTQNRERGRPKTAQRTS